ncbi:cytochrome P450 [Pseudosporangium ferrugineum]|uniref:Cytochrome P450 n=1 Tax=Pseudosporangium ferrugineum TaxID=439699 RepID=A0A2T0R909_9ACTN|nr:cytochrome P450 [Pseudosporangium ferrugineum]PRY17652.1 hypothetical protein CLV70_1517 [Pseudosporangium ferrugineum]
MNAENVPVTLPMFDREFNSAPGVWYRRLRQTGAICPIVLPTGTPAFLVTRYDVAREVLRHPALTHDLEFADFSSIPGFTEDQAAALKSQPSTVANTDGDEHHRLRAAISGQFSPRRIERLRPLILDECRRAISSFSESVEVDLVREYASPLTMYVICEIIGIPDADRSQFAEWTRSMLSPRQSDLANMPVAIGNLQSYLNRIVRELPQDLPEGLIRDLTEAPEDVRLSDDEIAAAAFLLLTGGHETTYGLISTILFQLVADARLREATYKSAGSVGAHLEEFLRLNSPLQIALPRYTKEEVEIAGVRIPAGATVVVGIMSADHDEAVFGDDAAERIVESGLRRQPSLAFGLGSHYCIGAALARLEAVLAVDTLLESFSSIELARPSHAMAWRPGLVFGLEELPVRLQRAT